MRYMHSMRRTPSYFSTAFLLLIWAMGPSVAFAQTVAAPHTAAPLLDSGQITSALLGGLWDAARSLWYVWLFVVAVSLINLFLSSRRRAALAASGIEEIDRMDGRTFEQRLAILFCQMNYSVELTPYAGDWGGDLVLHKDGVKTVVQAKRYKKAVGLRAVQEAVAAKAKYGCAEAMVVTNSVFTRQARELAQANRVSLWDRQRLVQALVSVKKEVPSTGTAASSDGIPSIPSGSSGNAHTPEQVTSPSASASFPAKQTCILCHKPVSEKVAAFCQANPARFEGRIYCFDHQKQARRLERTAR